MSKKEKVSKYLTDNRHVRATTVVAPKAVEEMRKILNASPVATVTLGRAMLGSLLMANNLTKGHSVGVYFKGNGPIGQVYAEGNFDGHIRGYCSNPQVHVPLKQGMFDIAGAIGSGILTVVRAHDQSEQVHKGSVEIQSGEVGEDIAYYLYQSHQIKSIVALSVDVDNVGKVSEACGIIIELMPGATEESIRKLEENVKNITSLSAILKGKDPHFDMVSEFLKGFKIQDLKHDTEVQHKCRCSKERAKNSIMLLGYKEIDKILEQDRSEIEIVCEFCGRKFNLSKSDLKKIRSESFKNSLN